MAMRAAAPATAPQSSGCASAFAVCDVIELRWPPRLNVFRLQVQTQASRKDAVRYLDDCLLWNWQRWSMSSITTEQHEARTRGKAPS